MKQEYMTHLYGDHLVSKTHPRIAFRGLVDTMEAEVIEAQVLARQLGEGECCTRLGEILDYLRKLMAAEVKETPLEPPFLFGMDAAEIQRQTHNPKESFGMDVPLPSYTQGPLAARLNTLRAKARELELLSVKVFGPKDNTSETPAQASQDLRPREDIILALNRLSSAFWWLFCEYIRKKA